MRETDWKTAIKVQIQQILIFKVTNTNSTLAPFSYII